MRYEVYEVFYKDNEYKELELIHKCDNFTCAFNMCFNRLLNVLCQIDNNYSYYEKIKRNKISIDELRKIVSEKHFRKTKYYLNVIIIQRI